MINTCENIRPSGARYVKQSCRGPGSYHAPYHLIRSVSIGINALRKRLAEFRLILLLQRSVNLVKPRDSGTNEYNLTPTSDQPVVNDSTFQHEVPRYLEHNLK